MIINTKKILLVITFCLLQIGAFANLILEKPMMIKSKMGDLYFDLKGYNYKADKNSDFTLHKKDNGLEKGYQGIDRVFYLKEKQNKLKIVSFTGKNITKNPNNNSLHLGGSQYFTFYDAGEGYNYIKHEKTGKYVTANIKENKITLEGKTRRNNQKWKCEYIDASLIAPPDNKTKFSIFSETNSRLSIDVPGAAPKQKNSESLKLWTFEDEPDRYFAFVQVEKNSEYFKIQPLHTTKVFDVREDSKKTKAKKGLKNAVKLVKGKKVTSTSYTKLKLRKYGSKSSQQFKFISTGEPLTYYIQNRGSKKYLTVDTNGKAEKGAAIFEYKFLNGNPNQKWKLKNELPQWVQPNPDWKYHIKTAYADEFFDLPGGGKETNVDGLKFNLWTISKGGKDQMFKILSAGDHDWVNFQVQNGGKFLTVPGNMKDNGTPLVIHKQTKGNDQKFAIYPTSKKTFVLRTKNWKAIDIPGGKLENGAKVTTYDTNYGTAQQFQLVFIDGPDNKIGKAYDFTANDFYRNYDKIMKLTQNKKKKKK